MTRKTQLEKFSARNAKKRADVESEKASQIKNSTIEKVGGKIAEKHGITTEDIFAVITRESVVPFVNIWNNSMQATIRETIRSEIKAVVREVVQEEMVAAYRGILRGLMPTIEPKIVEDVVREEAVEDVIKEEIVQTTVKLKSAVRRGSVKKRTQAEYEEQLKTAILAAHSSGEEPKVAGKFKKLGSHQNGLYQKFMGQNRGKRNAWADYVNDIITKNSAENR